MLWYKGQIFGGTQTAFDLADRGLLLGDGIFDTLLALNGRPFQIGRHLDRLVRGCAAIGLACDRNVIEGAVSTLASEQGSNCTIRTTVTRGPGDRGLLAPEQPAPTIFATSAGWSEDSAYQSRNVVISQVRRNAGSPLSRIKSLNYLDNVLALREASSRLADDALMLSTDGGVACASAGNVFIIQDDCIVTPPLSAGVLDGTIRAWILKNATALGLQAIEGRIEVEQLFEADSVFITNSARLIMPVTSLEGRPLRTAGHLSTLARALEGQMQTECGYQFRSSRFI